MFTSEQPELGDFSTERHFWGRKEDRTAQDSQTLDTLPSSTLEESASLAGRQPSLEQRQRRPRKNRPSTPHPLTRWIQIRGARRQYQREESEGSPVVPHSSGNCPRTDISIWSPQPGIRRRNWLRRAEEVDPHPELPQGIPTLRENFEVFVQLMDDPLVRKFLRMDKYFLMSDKYMLSMVVAYFIRAGRPVYQYKRFHFFLALYLANDMEQNVFVSKKVMLPFAFGYKVKAKERFIFRYLRLKFFEAIGGEASVPPEECEEIMAQDPFYWAWCRDRILCSTPVSWCNEDNRVRTTD
uniref:Speedy protein E4-like n=1 Tax=Ornithorhynchus anatinus TaxID=9258 RepID=A0A6I8N014_ORNAN